MSERSSGLIANILKDLGHEVPSESELERLIHSAAEKVVQQEGLDPAEVDLKFVPIEKKWMRDVLETDTKK